MRRHIACAMMLGLALVIVMMGRAQAQFYDLDGAYRCLTAPDDKCPKADTDLTPVEPPPAGPTVEEAIGKIRTGHVEAGDVAAIEKEAAAKEPRAVEALAWCKLNGIGMAADPVEAYRLYGEAAQLGIATARSNQVAIFETLLSQEQRQRVLSREQAQ